VTTPFICNAQTGSSKSAIVVSSAVKAELDAVSGGITGSGDGYGWVISFERGNNNGTRRKILSYVNGVIGFTPAIDKNPLTIPDKVRISKMFFFACWNIPITFYLPDASTAADISQVYVASPMAVESIGTTSTGEILGIKADISNVDKVIGNAIQQAGGLQGNRVILLKVFDGYTNQGKEYCLKDTMYIDTVTIAADKAQFTLESKFNIMDVQIPLCNYNRNFCRWRYKSTECLGTQTTLTVDSTSFPLGDGTWCDHSLVGPNGCLAHTNSRRYGGFPAIPARS
jgi:phage-related protein